MTTVIKVEGLSKKYIISHEKNQRFQYKTLQEMLLAGSRSFANKTMGLLSSGTSRQETEEFWALKDISFEIKQGERVGIIGSNGAGKSTLLKILSRITAPTQGKVTIRGRVASLLEVGTGFHPELTGRENIFLNGAILGMRRNEIKRKFDEIIDFADVEKFLDTPVKRYSSGMYVRLAFAVAAHLEPEILIVDEVLAVGDVQFQKKCLGKMQEVGRQGRTVLLVSHNLSAIRNLCSRSLWIESGNIGGDGSTDKIESDYLEKIGKLGSINAKKSSTDLEVQSVVLKDDDGHVTNRFKYGESITIQINCLAKKKIFEPYFWLAVRGAHGNLFTANMLLDGQRPKVLSGVTTLKCRFPKIKITPGFYTINMGVRDNRGRDPLIESGTISTFEILGTAKDLVFSGAMADVFLQGSSVVVLPYEWHFPDGECFRFEAHLH